MDRKKKVYTFHDMPSSDDSSEEYNDNLKKEAKNTVRQWSLKLKNFKNYKPFFIWLLLQIIFAWFEFGIVFFIVSMFIFIYINTGTRRNGLSAYSVFNPNLERIEGDTDPDQLDKSLRSGNMLM